MKKIIYSLLAISLLLNSCSDDEVTDISAVPYNKINISLDVTENDVTVNENEMTGDVAYTITASIPEAQALDYVVNFEQLGTATMDMDFSIERIIIPAGSISASTEIFIHKTGDPEEDETIKLIAVSNGDTADIDAFEFNATIIDDYKNDNLIMNIEWCSDYEFQFASGNLTGNYGDKIDLDIYLLDENTGNSVAMAATGSCPEHLELGGLPDGSYIVIVYVWDNKLSDLGLGITVPLNVSYEQEYFIDEIGFPHDLILTTDAPGDTNTAGIPIGPLARIVKTGYEFTVTTP